MLLNGWIACASIVQCCEHSQCTVLRGRLPFYIWCDLHMIYVHKSEPCQFINGSSSLSRQPVTVYWTQCTHHTSVWYCVFALHIKRRNNNKNCSSSCKYVYNQINVITILMMRFFLLVFCERAIYISVQFCIERCVLKNVNINISLPQKANDKHKSK